ncbi:MAG: hypothetical protein KBS35_01210 [Mycoplasma sp.]|nr:hypothetical protein [Candidatus Hennigella equi]
MRKSFAIPFVALTPTFAVVPLSISSCGKQPEPKPVDPVEYEVLCSKEIEADVSSIVLDGKTDKVKIRLTAKGESQLVTGVQLTINYRPISADQYTFTYYGKEDVHGYSAEIIIPINLVNGFVYIDGSSGIKEVKYHVIPKFYDKQGNLIKDDGLSVDGLPSETIGSQKIYRWEVNLKDETQKFWMLNNETGAAQIELFFTYNFGEKEPIKTAWSYRQVSWTSAIIEIRDKCLTADYPNIEIDFHLEEAKNNLLYVTFNDEFEMIGNGYYARGSETASMDLTKEMEKYDPLRQAAHNKELIKVRKWKPSTGQWIDAASGDYSYNEETTELTINKSLYQDDPEIVFLYVEFAMQVKEGKGAEAFCGETWQQLALYSDNTNWEKFLWMYQMNKEDFLGLERKVRWDGIIHKVKVIGVDVEKYTDDPIKPKFTFEFENLLTDKNYNPVKLKMNSGHHNWKSNFYVYFNESLDVDSQTNSEIKKYFDDAFLDGFASGDELNVEPYAKPIIKNRIVGTISDYPDKRTRWTDVKDRFFIETCTEMGGHQEGEEDSHVAEGKAYDSYTLIPGCGTDGAWEGRVRTTVPNSAGQVPNSCDYWTSSFSYYQDFDLTETYAFSTMFIAANGDIDHDACSDQKAILPCFCF